jgi:hypothetical protein
MPTMAALARVAMRPAPKVASRLRAPTTGNPPAGALRENGVAGRANERAADQHGRRIPPIKQRPHSLVRESLGRTPRPSRRRDVLGASAQAPCREERLNRKPDERDAEGNVKPQQILSFRREATYNHLNRK